MCNSKYIIYIYKDLKYYKKTTFKVKLCWDALALNIYLTDSKGDQMIFDLWGSNNIQIKFPLYRDWWRVFFWYCNNQIKSPPSASLERPIRGQYPGHVTTLDQSETSLGRHLYCVMIGTKLNFRFNNLTVTKNTHHRRYSIMGCEGWRWFWEYCHKNQTYLQVTCFMMISKV